MAAWGWPATSTISAEMAPTTDTHGIRTPSEPS